MQCATMNRRTLTMNWDGLGEDDDDRFFESRNRISSVIPLDLASSGSDDDEDEDFEDSRMSFVSTLSSASIKSIHQTAKSSSILAGYDMWMSEPGDIRERRKRLLQGMGLATSTKDMPRLASSKIVGAVSRKHENGTLKVDSAPSPIVKVDDSSFSPKKEENEHSSSPSPSDLHPTAVVLVRSRSDGDIDTFSNIIYVQLLLSSSMDKTVRMWDLETKSCLKMFAHNDYGEMPNYTAVTQSSIPKKWYDKFILSDRQVVDWTDLHEMVTAASYTPDGQVV